MLKFGSCEPATEIEYPLSSRPTIFNLETRQAVYSTDGSCGPSNGNTVCDPNSKAYTGGCCSVGTNMEGISY